MKEKINATSLIHTIEDKKRTSVVDVFNVAEVTETLKALQGEREDELQEIHRSWIDSAVDEILKEVKYASYDFIHIPISDVDPYISSVTIDDFVIGMKSSAYAILYNNELSLLPYVTYDKIDVDTSVFMTDATCITKGNNEVVILSSNGQGCKININAYKHGTTGATLEEVIQEHGYLQKLFTCPVEPFTDIVFIADRYIAVTGNGKIYKNIENSDNWEIVAEYQDKQFTAIASSGNALYCITNDGNSYLSVNYGDVWVNHPMPYPNQYSDITYSEEADTFIACSVNGDYRIAKWDKDSAMWRAFKSSTQHEWQSITSGNGVIVAVGNGVATASYDGEKWYNILIPNHDWTTVTRSNYFFYVFSADGHIVRSANGGITGILFATTDEALKGYETGKPVSPFTMHAFIDSLIATSDEAIEGTHQRKIITPFTMHAFIDSLITTSDEAIEGTHQRKIITPFTMHAFIDSLITTSDEAIEGTHQRKIITPFTMHAFINNSLPWGINKGGTGADTIEQAKINFELNNVDNTSDIDKPISTATQEALDGKVSKAGDTISGDLTINNDLTVEGTSTFDGNTTAESDLNVNGNLTVEGSIENSLIVKRMGGIGGLDEGGNPTQDLNDIRIQGMYRCNSKMINMPPNLNGGDLLVIFSEWTISQILIGGNNYYYRTGEPTDNTMTDYSWNEWKTIIANTDLQNEIDTKVNKAGDTMTGALTILKDNSSISIDTSSDSVTISASTGEDKCKGSFSIKYRENNFNYGEMGLTETLSDGTVVNPQIRVVTDEGTNATVDFNCDTIYFWAKGCEGYPEFYRALANKIKPYLI